MDQHHCTQITSLKILRARFGWAQGAIKDDGEAIMLQEDGY